MAFDYRNGVLCAEEAPLDDIARHFGTPCYVYSQRTISSAYGEFSQALAGHDARVCYSVKANSNLAILALLAKLGAGFDIVSGGELARVLAAGGEAAKTLFSGVGKSEAEVDFALSRGIGCINVESAPELERVAAIARRLGRRAPIALRVNPDIDARTHPYISTGLRETKFGVAYADAERLYREAAKKHELEIVGIGCHIGSLLNNAAPFVAAAERLGALVDRLQAAGIALRHIDVGGGIGIRYKDETPQSIGEFVRGALSALGRRRQQVIFDPGRSIVGNAGVLLTRVEYVKLGEARNFMVVDAAMNDLIRAPLYSAWHEVRTVKQTEASVEQAVYDVVGPVCESADFLAKERRLAAREGDLLAIMSAGAYGMVMSSNYNSRPRAAEVLVDGTASHLVRRREHVAELFALETIPA
ncbi:MAG: diaminopimelate decarboxylase [Betaproteobacteria bacterium]|nr:diaminopimelate decarboxylase [Betaproteobacteria bacterium]MBV9361472.1 diaminopimelate decarboxylase [Betaproteobacteria bacterium]